MKATIQTNFGTVITEGTPAELRELLRNDANQPSTVQAPSEVEKGLQSDNITPPKKKKAVTKLQVWVGEFVCSKCGKNHPSKKKLWGGKCRGGCDEPEEKVPAKSVKELVEEINWQNVFGMAEPKDFVRNLKETGADKAEILMEVKAKLREAGYTEEKGWTDGKISPVAYYFVKGALKK